MCLIISSYCVVSADVTICRSGAAVTNFISGFDAHAFVLDTEHIVLGENYNESKAIYEFYIPGNNTQHPLVTSITVKLYGTGTITNLILGTKTLGSVSGHSETLLIGDDLSVGTYSDAVNGDVFRIQVHVLNHGILPGDKYTLEKIELIYNYPSADETALKHFHTAYSAYLSISNFKREVVDATWGLSATPDDKYFKEGLRRTQAFCEALLDIEGDMNAAVKAAIKSIERFSNFVDVCNQAWDYLFFWNSEDVRKTTNNIKLNCDQAAAACASLAVEYQNRAFDGNYSSEDASAMLQTIQNANVTLERLKSNLALIATNYMHEDGGNAATLAKESMRSMMWYQENSTALNDSYLPKLIADISLQEEQFVTVTVNTAPSNKTLAFKVDSIQYTSSTLFVWESGSSHTIEALSPQSGNDSKNYGFVAWSDGGARSHTISPTSDNILTATYGTTPTSPSNLSYSGITNTSISWLWTDNAGDEDGFRGEDSANILKWTASSNATSYKETGLNANTQYTRHIHAYNQYGDSQPSNSHNAYTLANPPDTASFSNITTNNIQANWTANGNPTGTEFYCENISASTNSGWTTHTYWNSTGLASATSYTFRVKARNAEGQETTLTNLGSMMTQYDPELDSVTPASGPVGSFVKIDGRYFYDYGCCVKFSGADGQIIDWADSVIHTRLTPGTVTGDVRVYTSSYSNRHLFTVTNPDVIYVDPANTSRMENGTIEYPFSTLQRSLDAATPGDRIIAPSHTYTEDISAGAGIDIHFTGNALIAGQLTTGYGTNITSEGGFTVTGAAELGGNVKAIDLTFQSSVTATGPDQILDADTGTLLVLSTITKTTAGNLTLAGATLIDLNGAVNTEQAGGSLTVSHVLLAAEDIIAGMNILLDANVTLDGNSNQSISAETGSVWAKGDVTKSFPGTLHINSLHLIDLDGNVIVASDLHLWHTTVVAADTILHAGGSIILDDDKTLTGEGALKIEADDDIILGGDVTTHGTLILFADMNTDTAGTVQTKGHLTTTLGDIDIFASDSTIHLHNDVTAANDLLLNNSTEVASGVTLRAANNFVLADGKQLSGEGNLTIEAGNSIYLGGEVEPVWGSLVLAADSDGNGMGNVEVKDNVLAETFVSSGVDFSNIGNQRETGFISADASVLVWAPVPGNLPSEDTGLGMAVKQASGLDIESFSAIYNMVLFTGNHSAEFSCGIGYLTLDGTGTFTGEIAEVAHGQTPGEALREDVISGTYSITFQGQLLLRDSDGTDYTGCASADASLLAWATVPGDLTNEETGIGLAFKQGSQLTMGSVNGTYNIVAFNCDRATEFSSGIGQVTFDGLGNYEGQVDDISDGQASGSALGGDYFNGTYSVGTHGAISLSYSDQEDTGFISADGSLIVWTHIPDDGRRETGIYIGIKQSLDLAAKSVRGCTGEAGAVPVCVCSPARIG